MARSRVGWRLAAGIAIAVLGALVIVVVAASSDDEAVARGPAPPCPHEFVEQLGRSDGLRRLLASVEEGAALLDALGSTEVRFCFGTIEVPVLSDDRVLLLDAGADEAETAARAGHLLHHAVYGSPFPAEVAPDASCDDVVRGALAAEARAYALEVRLRRALGVEGRRYAFEAAYVPTEAGERGIFEYLLANPTGGPGLDPLGAAYRQRCEVARRAPRSTLRSEAAP